MGDDEAALEQVDDSCYTCNFPCHINIQLTSLKTMVSLCYLFITSKPTSSERIKSAKNFNVTIV